VSRSSTNHAEEQPAHLKLRKAEVAVEHNLATYDGPEGRYCPAGVYEFVQDEETGKCRLQINFSVCLTSSVVRSIAIPVPH
jgi:electron-transferring-flavoprotein dehydrogenase